MSSWALGWQIRHTPRGDVIQHYGNNKGFHAARSLFFRASRV